jgi:PAS domain S-box-containing protein
MTTVTGTILHVDDDERTRYLLSQVLQHEGFRVLEAATGSDALVQVAAQPDLIILDVHLPDMDGYQVCQKIKASPTTATIPVLHLSGHLVGAEDKARGLDVGADAYLTKPVEPSELIATVRALLRNHQAEEAARAAAREWQTTFDAIHDSVALLDRDGRVQRCNRSLASLLGRPPEQTVGQLYRDALPEPLRATLRPLLERVDRIDHGQSEEIDTGERHFLVTVDPVREEQGPVHGSVWVLMDITQRTRLETQLRQAQKMEAIGRLAGGIAHDFNNLLTAILGYCDMLQDGMGREDPLRGLVQEIDRAGQRAGGLTNQLLAFSRKQIVAPRVLDLNQLVAETAKMLRRLIGEDIILSTVVDPEPTLVKADPGQLQQVLLNLAVNSRDALPRGGRLAIQTRCVSVDANGPRLGLDLAAGSYVLLDVADSGCGMTEEVRAHLFEPFFTTKGPGHGTGLGLSTVYGIVKQSGGDIDVDSQPGHGTRFRIYLPRVQSETSEPLAQVLSRALRGSETILLVEDERQVRDVVNTVLRRQGYQVLEATDGAEALRMAEGHTAPINLLITDVVMPQLSGPDLARRLLQARPQLRVLYMSGYTGSALLPPDVQAKGTAFLQKPFTSEVLLRQVRAVLDRRA